MGDAISISTSWVGQPVIGIITRIAINFIEGIVIPDFTGFQEIGFTLRVSRLEEITPAIESSNLPRWNLLSC